MSILRYMIISDFLVPCVRTDEEEDQDALEIASKYDLNARSAATDASVKAHVCVPTQDDIGAIVVDEKKRLLLEKFSMM